HDHSGRDHAGRDHGHGHGDHHGHRHGGPFGERAELVAALVAAALWVVAFVLHLTVDGVSGLTTGMNVAAVLFAGWFTAQEAFAKVRARQFEIDALMLVAAVGAAAIGHWQDAALLLVLFSLGHALEGYAMGRARRAIASLAELAPDVAVLRDGEREVPVGD